MPLNGCSFCDCARWRGQGLSLACARQRLARGHCRRGERNAENAGLVPENTRLQWEIARLRSEREEPRLALTHAAEFAVTRSSKFVLIAVGLDCGLCLRERVLRTRRVPTNLRFRSCGRGHSRA